MWDGWGFPSLSPETAWAKVVIPGIASGETIVSLLPAWQTEIENEARQRLHGRIVSDIVTLVTASGAGPRGRRRGAAAAPPDEQPGATRRASATSS